MLEFVNEVMRSLENDPGVTTRRDAITGLRPLGLDDFGYILLSMPDPSIRSFQDYFLRWRVTRCSGTGRGITD